MSPLPVPTKTSLGQAALRRRTGEIGPRHRTLLFLVDGRRPLSEVLSLAHQAGSATSHFEDLVRMGYVELPAETLAPPVAAEPASEPVEPLDVPPPAEITALAVEVGEVPAPVEDEPQAVVEAVESVPAAVPEPPVVAPAAAAAPAPAPAPARAPARRPRVAPVVDELRRRPFLPPGRGVPPGAQAAAPRAPGEEAPALERARDEVLECLRCDPQPNSARIAERARAVRSGSEMIEVVWTMERGLHHHQRTHRGLIALQRARELLGLGNTLVDEDSKPGLLDEDW